MIYIEICTLFSIKIKCSVAFKHKPLREDKLSTKDKWPNTKVSSLRRFHCISLLQDMYSKVNSCVRVNGNTSQFFLVTKEYAKAATIVLYSSACLSLIWQVP